MLPPRLACLESWVDERSLNRCFQLMETEEPSLFDQWIANWSDLVAFEIVPVIKSGDAAARIVRLTSGERFSPWRRIGNVLDSVGGLIDEPSRCCATTPAPPTARWSTSPAPSWTGTALPKQNAGLGPSPERPVVRRAFEEPPEGKRSRRRRVCGER